MKKYMLIIISLYANITPASWLNVYSTPIQEYHASPGQAVGNEASARLAALKENRAKHAQIRQEAAQGKYERGRNFATVSAEKQAVIDQPAKEYFARSWIPQVVPAEGINIEAQFKANRPAIKENFRQAQNLANAQIRGNLANLVISKVPQLSLSLLNTGIDTFNKLPSAIESQTAVGNVFYKNVYNPQTGKYEIKRSGIDNSDTFVPEKSKETIQQYADRLIKADQEIKPIDPKLLKEQIAKENSMLASGTHNTAIYKSVGTNALKTAAPYALPYALPYVKQVFAPVPQE